MSRTNSLAEKGNEEKNQQQENIAMRKVSPILLEVTFNVSGLNFQIKRQI